MNSFTNKRLALPTSIPVGTPSTVYVTPANTTTIITVITVAHTAPSSGSITSSMYLCPANADPSDANALFKDISVDPQSVVNFNFGQAIQQTDTIKVVASSLGLTLHLSGIEIL